MSWGKPCRQVGPYKISGSSAAVEGEHDAIFYEDVKFVTLRTTDAKLVEAMGLAGCNLKRDIKTKISTTGCARWKPVAACRADHDLKEIAFRLRRLLLRLLRCNLTNDNIRPSDLPFDKKFANRQTIAL